jgi:YHS domain-containing protein
MKRIIWTLAALVAIGAPFAVTPALSADRPAGEQESTAAPTAKIGDQVTCALDGMKMSRAADTPSAEYRGKVYYFCGDAEKQTFLKDPERYTKH